MTTPYPLPSEDSYSSYTPYPGSGNTVNTRKNPWAVAALITSILALVASFLVLGGFIGLIALILSIVALVKSKNYMEGARRRGMSIVALVLSFLSFILSAVMMSVLFAFYSEYVTHGECDDLSGDAYVKCWDTHLDQMK